MPALPHAADSKWCGVCGARLSYEAVYLGHLGAWSCPRCGNARPALDVSATGVAFDGLDGTAFTLVTPLGERRVRMPLPGLYNVYNALAAVSMACALGDVALERMAAGLEVFGPAFGRFERVAVDGREAVLVLSKNPAGANEVIRTLAHDPAPKRLVVALNDRIADGRDVSWIWDVDFELLAGGVESVVTSGTRAAEMAVRLKYAGVDRTPSASSPISRRRSTRPWRPAAGRSIVLTTYTAMLELRGVLTRRGVVPPVLGGRMTDLARVPSLSRAPEHLRRSRQHRRPALSLRAARDRVRGGRVRPGDDLPEADLYYLGGGQDRDQVADRRGSVAKAGGLRSAVDGGAAVLAVCGGYQMLGH